MQLRNKQQEVNAILQLLLYRFFVELSNSYVNRNYVVFALMQLCTCEPMH